LRDQQLPGRLVPIRNSARIWRSASSRRGERIPRELAATPESALAMLGQALEYQRQLVERLSAGQGGELDSLLSARDALLRQACRALDDTASPAAVTELVDGSSKLLERLVALGRELGRLEAKIDQLSDTSSTPFGLSPPGSSTS
jgi:hypothetical protein